MGDFMKNFKIKVFFKDEKNVIIDNNKIYIEDLYENILSLYIKYIDKK